MFCQPAHRRQTLNVLLLTGAHSLKTSAERMAPEWNGVREFNVRIAGVATARVCAKWDTQSGTTDGCIDIIDDQNNVERPERILYAHISPAGAQTAEPSSHPMRT